MTDYREKSTISKVIRDENNLPTVPSLLNEDTAKLPEAQRLRKIQLIGQMVEIYAATHRMGPNDYGRIWNKYDDMALSELEVYYGLIKK